MVWVENVVIGAEVVLVSKNPQEESRASIPEATFVADAALKSVAATPFRSIVFPPVIQGAKVTVASTLQDVPLQVAEHPVATAEQVFMQLPPATH